MQNKRETSLTHQNSCLNARRESQSKETDGGKANVDIAHRVLNYTKSLCFGKSKHMHALNPRNDCKSTMIKEPNEASISIITERTKYSCNA